MDPIVQKFPQTSAAAAANARRAERSEWFLSPTVLIVLFGVHVGLALAAQRSSLVSTVWAGMALAVGLVAATQRNSWERTSLVVAYVSGAELIWRGTHALVFWEYGKYLAILVMGLVILKGRGNLKFDRRAVVFAICMAPSLLALPHFDRSDIAFNISGPVCLAVAVVFFSGKRISRPLLGKLSASFLAPVVGLAALSTFGVFSADVVDFRIGGKATTAGIGPNQVSSTLGLGLFIVCVLLMIGPKRTSFRLFTGGIGIWLAGQTLLSFSRGGFYTAVGAAIVAAFPLMRSPRSRWYLAFGSIFAILIFQFAVIPVTDRVTQGMVSERITDTTLTGRDKIMKADWIIFLRNPILGVGPGQSYSLHAITFRASSAHTEYTRLLAEHGIFGVLAIVMLFSMGWSRWRRPESPMSRAAALGFTAWALLYLGHAAMRQVLPAFAFGLGGAYFFWGDGGWRRRMKIGFQRHLPLRQNR